MVSEGVSTSSSSLGQRRALALDPGHVEVLGTLAFILGEAGCLAEARSLATRALWSDPTAPYVRATKCYVHALAGQWRAIEETAYALDLPRWRAQTPLIIARFLAQAKPGSRTATFLRQLAAELLAYAGDSTRAWAYVEQAEATRRVDALWLERCPVLHDLRERPAARAMIADAKRRSEAIRRAYEAPLPARVGA